MDTIKPAPDELVNNQEPAYRPEDLEHAEQQTRTHAVWRRPISDLPSIGPKSTYGEEFWANRKLLPGGEEDNFHHLPILGFQIDLEDGEAVLSVPETAYVNSLIDEYNPGGFHFEVPSEDNMLKADNFMELIATKVFPVSDDKKPLYTGIPDNYADFIYFGEKEHDTPPSMTDEGVPRKKMRIETYDPLYTKEANISLYEHDRVDHFGLVALPASEADRIAAATQFIIDSQIVARLRPDITGFLDRHLDTISTYALIAHQSNDIEIMNYRDYIWDQIVIGAEHLRYYLVRALTSENPTLTKQDAAAQLEGLGVTFEIDRAAFDEQIAIMQALEPPQDTIVAEEIEPEPNEVKEQIIAAIKAKGKITFAEFMSISLYARGEGYYASGRVEIDAQGGDFVTSPEVSPVFGAVTAEAINSYWHELGEPDDFQIVEMGAGNGTWAKDILDELEKSYPELAKAVKYTIVEYSPGLIAKQQKTLVDNRINWVHGSASQLPIQNVTGVFISNELPDAFPVHRITKRNGKLQELYVELDEQGKLVETAGTISDPAVRKLVVGQEHMSEGSVRVVNPAAVSWMRQVGEALERGYVITIDYGGWYNFEERDYENTDARIYSSAYMGNTAPENAYKSPGQVDITSDVDFGALEIAGLEVGLQPVRRECQADFLNAYGFWERFSKRSSDLAIKQMTEALSGKEAAELAHGAELADQTKAPGSFATLVQRKM